VFGPWSHGTPLLMYGGPFEVEQRLSFVEKHQVDILCAAPTELRLMVQLDLSRWDLRSLRHCVSAGEPLNPEVIERWKAATGLDIYDGYGLTEALMACHNYRSVPIRPGSMGKPLPGYQMAIVDVEGQPLAPRQEGDLAIQAANPCMMLGHWGNPDALRDACRGEWFITGDRGWIDDDGYFWFIGRGDDVILSAGYRIGPFEVESALATHPAVLESAAVGSPDPIRGEIVKAFVVLGPGREASGELVAELQQHVRRETAPYKYPRSIEFVAELPKTITGKIRRGELKQAEIRRQGIAMGTQPPDKG
jgi:acyl-coenzyme A synthetase/AMP-(fatty) acid ligase